MRASVRGRDELAARVRQGLMLPTKKQAEQIVDVVIASLESTLLNNLGTNGFTLKLGSFGKFSVRHKPGILRKIPFTGATILDQRQTKGQAREFGGASAARVRDLGSCSRTRSNRPLSICLCGGTMRLRPIV